MHRLVIVYEHKPEVHWDYIKVRNDYDLERGVSGALDGLSEKEIANIDPVSLSQEHMIPGLDVIGVVAQYSTADYERNGGRWGHGLIVLFQWDRSIRYCYTFTRGLSDVVSIVWLVSHIYIKYLLLSARKDLRFW